MDGVAYYLTEGQTVKVKVLGFDDTVRVRLL